VNYLKESKCLLFEKNCAKKQAAFFRKSYTESGIYNRKIILFYHQNVTQKYLSRHTAYVCNHTFLSLLPPPIVYSSKLQYFKIRCGMLGEEGGAGKHFLWFDQHPPEIQALI